MAAMTAQQARQFAANQVIAAQSRAASQMFMALKAVQADIRDCNGALSSDAESMVDAAIALVEGK